MILEAVLQRSSYDPSVGGCVVIVPLETRREARLRVPGAGGSGKASSTDPRS
jgi:hypothetical protein